MQKLRLTQLVPGESYPKPLFMGNGQKLLAAGVPMTERHILSLRRCGELEVYLAETVDELAKAGLLSQSDSDGLKVGQVAERDILSSNGSVILEQGQAIEQHHIDAIKVGGASFQTEKKNDRKERIIMADELVEDLESHAKNLRLRFEESADHRWIHPEDASTWPSPDKLSMTRAHHVEIIRQIYAKVEAGVMVEVSDFDPVVDELMLQLSLYPTQFTQLALMCPRREDYLPDHAFTTTVLAMTIALNLQWSREDVRLAAIAGLVFDLGMLLIPERIRVGSSELSDIDRNRVQRHPIFSISMLDSIKGVPKIVKLAALQHHERENGSGYPRGRRRDAICDLARALGVADTFAAATEPRHYRQAKLPYNSMEEILRAAAANIYWPPAVKALVRSAGLFPVGSYVKLSTGDEAVVTQANIKYLDRPMIQLLNADSAPSGQSLDLSSYSKNQFSVIRAIPAPAA